MMSTTYHDLTEPQRDLLVAAEQAEDSAEFLRAHQAASDADKAAVAELLGGPGAGAEFLP